MVQIDNTVISFDLFDQFFLCDLAACKGICCVEGDSGAPLTPEEAAEIERDYPVFGKYLNSEYKSIIEKEGFAVVDSDGDLVTPIVGKKECVYTFTDENGITKCAIEKAWLNGEIAFRKPISCHLYPIRITPYKHFDAINYQQLDICKSGRLCGAKSKLPLYKFLKEPLIRKYGEEWYAQLEIAAIELSQR